FENDSLYAFPHTTKARIFRYTKENALSEMCNSTYALSSDGLRFSLTEGNGAFARPWATLLAQHWIQYPFIADGTEGYECWAWLNQLQERSWEQHSFNDIEEWLTEPRKRFEQWIYTTWLPAINARNRDQRLWWPK